MDHRYALLWTLVAITSCCLAGCCWCREQGRAGSMASHNNHRFLIKRIPCSGGDTVTYAPTVTMDFNVKKLASDAGVFFTRAVQFTEEKLGQAEKTELDTHLENLISRADHTKNWTEKIYRQTEVLLQPNPSARIEEFFYEKLDKKVPSRITNGEILGQYMRDASRDFGPETPYGSTLGTVGEYQRRLGGAEREFLLTSSMNFLTPLRNFLEGDWKTISKEKRLLENRRLDLDICKARLKKAKQAEAKAAAAPDFQETRPRNYVLSASASALLSEEVDKTEFDRQAEVTRLLLEGISSTHAKYYSQCHQFMLELQKELSGMSIEDMILPATGTRMARVLYDYDAHDSSELSLLADEVITVYTVPGMDPDWLVGEKGNQKGKVPVTYLELLS
ncbi:hypothetical protein NHX12_026993 [Muraenolepis orangiensis]|uniref:SH3 domain-containing GRB2-like protein B1 n=1 Tax=Muraenolepis orangiensis TaxID=630683 RepID=A0A9Q0EBL5_9TELE|nr:hypothetical protein NHX12_026993 [Muraenolepis orangiensis]